MTMPAMRSAVGPDMAPVPVDYQKRSRVIDEIEDLSQMAREVVASPINITSLQPVTGTVAFTPTAGTLSEGYEVEALVDEFNQAGGRSGLLQNNKAFASFAGGEVPNGQIILLHSLGVSLYDINGATASEISGLIFNTSVTLNLRGTDLDNMGAMVDWTDVLGATGGQRNGRRELGRYAVAVPTVLQPTDPLAFKFRVERDIPLAAEILAHVHFRATRIYDRRVLGLS